MFSKSRILVLFVALCAFAATETIQKSSAQFAFVQGTGVLQSKTYSMNGMYFSCKRLVNGKGAISFSWSLPSVKTDMGKISLYTVSGKLIKSFNVKSQEGRISWSMPHARMASGVYFAVLSYGTFKKNLRIVY